jgi:isocitrate lyase
MSFLSVEQLKKDWAENPRWKGIKRGYTARRRGAAARQSCRLNTVWRNGALRSCGT